MGLNFQDVIRDVHDPVNHALQTTGGSANSTVYIGTPTLYAVVNTGGSAANVTLNPSPNFIGLVTVGNDVNVTATNLDIRNLSNGSDSVSAHQGGNWSVQVLGNVTLSSSPNFIGLTTAVTALPNGLVDSFGHLITGDINNQIDIQYYRGQPSSLVTVVTANSGTANATLGMATYLTTTAGSSQAKGITRTNTVYTAGAEIYAIFTAGFTGNGTGTSYQRIGLYDGTNGFYIGDEGGTFGATVLKNGTPTQTAKASFSEDALTGAAGSEFTRNGTPEAIDLTKLNVWKIRFGWVGSAPISFEVLSPDGNWVTFHKILQPNLAALPSIDNADLPVTCDVNNGDSGTALSIITNCWAAGTTQSLTRMDGAVTDATLAQLGRTVITGETTAGGGGYVNVKVSPSGAIEVGGTVSLGAGTANIGFATVSVSNIARTITGNLTLSDSKTYIGLTSVSGTVGLSAGVANIGFATVNVSNLARTITGNLTLSDSKGFIGLTTTTLGASPAFIGIVTVANSQTNTGNVTLNGGPNQIGSVTVSNPITIGNAMVTVTLGTKLDSTNDSISLPANTTVIPGSAWANPNTFIGLVTSTVSNTARSIAGNLTLSDSKGFIGLTTSVIGSAPTLYAVVNTSAAGQSSVVLDAGANWVGLATVQPAAAWPDPTTYIGLVTATMSGSVNTGMTTIFPGPNYIGLVTADIGTIKAWTDPTTYIGLVTATLSGSVNTGMTTLFPGPNQIGSVTVSNQVSSNIVGNVTLSDSKAYIGLTSVSGSVGVNAGANYIGLVTAVVSSTARSITGNLTLSDSKGFIGLVTAVPSTTTRSLVGNLTLSDSKAFIGLTTTVLGSAPTLYAVVNTAAAGQSSVVLDTGTSWIGIATVWQASLIRSIAGNLTIDSQPAWSDPNTFIGLVTAVPSTTSRSLVGNLTLSDSKGFIGLVSIGGGVLNTITAVTDITNPVAIKGNLTLSDAKTYIGLVTSSLGIGTQFIGLVTAWTRNAGTSKTLIQLPVGLGNNSLSTVAVPTNAQRIKVTQLILNSNVTTEIAIKSGVTYLTGNASLGETLFPGGGFVLPGSPDSPSWLGLPSGALVVEKRDPGGTVSKVAGHAIYFDET